MEPYRGFARCILAIFQKYAICSILAYPFKPHPLKNVQNHDMVPLQSCHPLIEEALEPVAGWEPEMDSSWGLDIFCAFKHDGDG